MGGLKPSKTTGESAPYYATSTTEVLFHVSTRIPGGTKEEMHNKVYPHAFMNVKS